MYGLLWCTIILIMYEPVCFNDRPKNNNIKRSKLNKNKNIKDQLRNKEI